MHQIFEANYVHVSDRKKVLTMNKKYETELELTLSMMCNNSSRILLKDNDINHRRLSNQVFEANHS